MAYKAEKQPGRSTWQVRDADTGHLHSYGWPNAAKAREIAASANKNKREAARMMKEMNPERRKKLERLLARKRRR